MADGIVNQIEDLTKEQLEHLLLWLNAHNYTPLRPTLTLWRQTFKDLHTWKRDPLIDFQTHISHCNFGEYPGSCKYGPNEQCPALSEQWSWLGEAIRRGAVAVYENDIDPLLLEQVLRAHQRILKAGGYFAGPTA